MKCGPTVNVVPEAARALTQRSVRYTTSSRRPGATITGAVEVRAADLVTCADCGRLWMGGHPGAHAPRITRATCGHLTRTNCVGRALVPCAECSRGG